MLAARFGRSAFASFFVVVHDPTASFHSYRVSSHDSVTAVPPSAPGALRFREHSVSVNYVFPREVSTVTRSRHASTVLGCNHAEEREKVSRQRPATGSAERFEEKDVPRLVAGNVTSSLTSWMVQEPVTLWVGYVLALTSIKRSLERTYIHIAFEKKSFLTSHVFDDRSSREFSRRLPTKYLNSKFNIFESTNRSSSE